MNIKMAALISMLLLPVVSNGAESGNPISADTIQVLKISSQDQRAVIKTADGEMKIIKAGDVLRVKEPEKKDKKEGPRVASSEFRVMEIAAGRIVFEENGAEEPETIIIRLENGQQRLERTKRTAEKMPRVRALPKNERERTRQKKEK